MSKSEHDVVNNFIKDELERMGYSGLYLGGDCGCSIDDLAPCGDSRIGKNGWLNDCSPGYKHIDPRSSIGDFLISQNIAPPTPEEFDEAFGQC